MKTLAQKIRAALLLSTLAAGGIVAVAASTEDAEAGITINLHQACIDQGGSVTMKATAYSAPISDVLFCDFSARASTCPVETRFDMTTKRCVTMKPEASVANDDTACWRSDIPLSKPHAPNACPKGWENGGLSCYGACPSGFNPVGSLCWSGATSAPRPETSAKCGGRESFVAGLCYENVGRSTKPCPDGFNLVGAVCYATCPADFPVTCGAACATSGSTCEKRLIAQITTPMEVAGSVMAAIAAAVGVPALVESTRQLADAYNLKVCPGL